VDFLSTNSNSFGRLPANIEITLFRDEPTLRVLLEYCLLDAPYFFSNLEGLPLLLNQSGRLRKFSASDPIYLSPFHDLIPDKSDKFLHLSLVGSVFKEIDIESCEMFLRFDVEAFASMLPDVLSEVIYRTKTSRITFGQEDPESLPSAQWLSKVWTFLRSEYRRASDAQLPEEGLDERTVAERTLKPLADWCLIPALVRTGVAIKNGPKSMLN